MALLLKKEKKIIRDTDIKKAKALAKRDVPPAPLTPLQKRLQKITEQVNKVHPNSICLASEMPGAVITKIPTGVVGMDMALLGGFAQNRLIELAGEFSVGKTTIAYHSHANFQSMQMDDGASYVVNTEQEVDPRWMKFNGMDDRRTFISTPLTGEETSDYSADALEIMLEGGIKVCMSVDSIASMIPAALGIKDAKASHMGKFPALITNYCKRLLIIIRNDAMRSDPRCTVLFLNQKRMEIGKMFGDPETFPGGEGKKHWVSQLIGLKPAGFLTESFKVGTGKEEQYTIKQAAAQKARFNVKKNKCHGFRNMSGEFTFFNKSNGIMPGGSFDNPQQLLNLSLAYGVTTINKVDKKTVVEIPSIGFKTTSKQALLTSLITDPGVYSTLYEAVLLDRQNNFWRTSLSGEVVEQEETFELSDEEAFD